MPNSELVRINEIRRAHEEPPFANPRNSTAGSLKLLDSKLCAQRRLRFVSHGLGVSEGIDVSSYSEISAGSSKWGIPLTPHIATYDSIEEVIATRRAMVEPAEHARLPDRRAGDQGRRPRPARPARDDEQEPCAG